MNLEERVLRLERANRTLGLTLGAVVVALGVVLLSAAGGDRRISADHIDAHSISVQPPSGKNRVELFGQKDEFAGVSIAGLDGKPTGTLVVTPSGVPNLCFSDKKTCRLLIGDSEALNRPESEGFSIQTRSANGEVIWTAPAK